MRSKSCLFSLPKSKLKTTEDLLAKRLLSRKQVVARIMRWCIPEFRQCSLEFIMERCLASPSEPADSSSPPQAECVQLLSTEKALPEAKSAIRLDLLFEAFLPPSPPDSGKMLINLEIQNDARSLALLANRGIFYLSSILFSQYGHVFKSPRYDQMEPVCSIWICPVAPVHMANQTITWKGLWNHALTDPRNAEKLPDKLRLAIVGTNGETPIVDNVHGFIAALTSPRLLKEDRKQILEETFGMTMTEETLEEMDYDYLRIALYGPKRFAQAWKEWMVKETRLGISIGEQRGEKRGIEIGEQRGITIGEQRGIIIGEQRGEKRAKRQTMRDVVKSMRNHNYSDDKIKDILHISSDELKDIKKSLQ